MTVYIHDELVSVPHHSKRQCLKLTQVAIAWPLDLCTRLECKLLSALYILHIHHPTINIVADEVN